MATATSKTATTARTGNPATKATADAQPDLTGTAAEPAEVTSELVHLNPSSLLIEGNIRRKADLDEDFLASVREHGVLIPIVAVRTEQGVQVRYGQRRTLAAIQTQRPTVPVVVFSAAPGAELGPDHPAVARERAPDRVVGRRSVHYSMAGYASALAGIGWRDARWRSGSTRRSLCCLCTCGICRLPLLVAEAAGDVRKAVGAIRKAVGDNMPRSRFACGCRGFFDSRLELCDTFRGLTCRPQNLVSRGRSPYFPESRTSRFSIV